MTIFRLLYSVLYLLIQSSIDRNVKFTLILTYNKFYILFIYEILLFAKIKVNLVNITKKCALLLLEFTNISISGSHFEKVETVIFKMESPM